MRAFQRMSYGRRLERTPGYDGSMLAHVVNSADAMLANWPGPAESYLKYIIRDASTTTPAGRVARIFARALLARLTGDAAGGGNLYSCEPSPGAMLAAFQKLVEATPFIRFGYQAANAAILDTVANRRAVHVVDIGIGGGSQWFGFLDALAERGSRAPEVRLTGIDVPMDAARPLAALDEVGARLSRRAAELGLRFSFQPVASAVQSMDFGLLKRRAGEALAVNAVFALHHVPTTDGGAGLEDSRTRVLRRLREASPDVLAIVEPDAEHNSLPLDLLTRESIAHYLTVFDALAAMLPGNGAEREVLEQAFFGREILNILSTDGVARVERHERHTNWERRLRAAGFAPARCGRAAAGCAAARDASDAEGRFPVSVHANGRGLRLAWKNRSLVAATAWR